MDSRATMTVRQLRAAIDDIPDDREVRVRVIVGGDLVHDDGPLTEVRVVGDRDGTYLVLVPDPDDPYGTQALIDECLQHREQCDETRALAQHLAVITERYCEVTGSPETGQRRDGGCSERPVAIRWEHGFADEVCEHHAATAAARGALVVRPSDCTCGAPETTPRGMHHDYCAVRGGDA